MKDRTITPLHVIVTALVFGALCFAAGNTSARANRYREEIKARLEAIADRKAAAKELEIQEKRSAYLESVISSACYTNVERARLRAAQIAAAKNFREGR